MYHLKFSIASIIKMPHLGNTVVIETAVTGSQGIEF